MRLLILGGSGMLGSDLVSEAERRGWEVVAPDRDSFDITNPMHAAQIAAGDLGRFDACVNCAAYTAVDKAEEDKELAWQVNALAPSYISRACGVQGIRFVQVSTDFVFDGRKTNPYVESDFPNPSGVYANSKLQGEEAAIMGSPNASVVRTSWLFGPNGASFPRTMIRAWLTGKALKVVSDQVGTPTYTGDLARTICDVLSLNLPGGIYHAGGPEIMNWRTFAERAIIAYRDSVLKEGRPVDVTPISTEDWPTPVKRPAYSALSFSKLEGCGVRPMRPLDEALAEFAIRLPDPV